MGPRLLDLLGLHRRRWRVQREGERELPESLSVRACGSLIDFVAKDADSVANRVHGRIGLSDYLFDKRLAWTGAFYLGVIKNGPVDLCLLFGAPLLHVIRTQLMKLSY